MKNEGWTVNEWINERVDERMNGAKDVYYWLYLLDDTYIQSSLPQRLKQLQNTTAFEKLAVKKFRLIF